MTRLSSSVDWMWPQKESARLKISQQKFLKLKEKLKKKEEKKKQNRASNYCGMVLKTNIHKIDIPELEEREIRTEKIF